ncbi:MAG: hypothetical protein KAI47_12080, partial [Deltaproteobacteria bacterium]|nr:hypothetical protein [Deltaproteobacteria bacterium]
APLPNIVTSEESRIGTDDAIAALPELGGSDSGSASESFAYPRRRRSSPALGVLPEVFDQTTEDPIAQAEGVAAERTTPIAGVPAMAPADLHGKLEDPHEPSVVRSLFRLAADEETGLLMLQRGDEVKEIYFVDGDPRSVNSNRGDELFGQYLVRKRVINPGELSMALAMLPHFNGKLGDTLVALKLLRPVQVLRHLTHQVRQKLLEIFTWDRGAYFFYRGHRGVSESAPLGLDAFELIGTGVSLLDAAFVEGCLLSHLDRVFEPVKSHGMPPEIFRLGRLPRQTYEKHDGRQKLGQLLAAFDPGPARDAFLRMTYLLIETGLVEPRS